MKNNINLGFVFVLILAFSACKNNGTEESTTSGEHNCYSFTSDKDTIKMDITINDKVVSGSLDYNYYEKDKNTGTIRGELKGNSLTAIYTFMSEGVESSRQIIFKKTGDSFTEGYYVDGNNTIVDYPGTVILHKVNCE